MNILEPLTLFILIDFPIHIDSISMDLSTSVFILANSADPGEMPAYLSSGTSPFCKVPVYLVSRIKTVKA